MLEFKRNIHYSFFNPVLFVLPLLAFFVVSIFTKGFIPWVVFFSLLAMSIAFVALFFKPLFFWCFFYTGFLLSSVLIIFVLQHFLSPSFFLYNFVDVFVFLFQALLMLLFFKPLKRISSKFVAKNIPMKNNFSELKKSYLRIIAAAVIYLIIVLVSQNFLEGVIPTIFKISYLVLFVLLFSVLLIRVYYIRHRLKKEEWLPIVTEEGKITGVIQHSESFFAEEKYRHPVVRLLLINKGNILLSKQSVSCLEDALYWDTPIQSYMQIDETAEMALEKNFNSFFKQKPAYFFLTHYLNENKYEQQYVFLYVACNFADIKEIKSAKWWTCMQIKANIESGIFTPNFVTEYNLLERTGFLEINDCQSDCRLKETIYKLLEEPEDSIKKS